MKKLIFILFLLASINIFSQTNYMSNNHVAYKVDIENDQYVVHFTFKDHQNITCSLTWRLNKVQTDRDINKFGIPKYMLGPYIDNYENNIKRKEILKNGLFMIRNNYIVVDKNAMINEYSNYTKVIANWMINYLKDNYIDNRLNRIKLAMCFVQDIPYAVPDEIDPNWYYGGVIPIPNIITCGYGDCDTKAILFAGILCHLIDPDDIRFAGEPGHLYTIIKSDDINLMENGTTTYFALKDGYYYIADTAGPRRLAFGEAGDQIYSTALIQEVQFFGKQL